MILNPIKSENPIIIKSPTRVDLSGGTLDMWPLYNFVGGPAKTINMAIDIWTQVELSWPNSLDTHKINNSMNSNKNSGIKIKSLDLQKEWIFKNLAELMNSLDPKLLLFQKILEPFLQIKEYSNKLDHSFQWVTSSESPIGGGLGGSSSLVITLIKTIYYMLDKQIENVYEIVQLAHHIEASVLRTPTGTQDYFPAVTGGLSIIDYSMNGISQKVISVSETPFNDHCLLVYTGKSHHSGLNNFEVLKSAVEGDVQVLDALSEIKIISEEMEMAIVNNNWSAIPFLFQKEYEARIKLAPAFTSPEIEKLSQICLKAGALAVKICGAGGGGCVLVWVQPQHKEKVVQVCQNEKFLCLKAKPINPLTV